MNMQREIALGRPLYSIPEEAELTFKFESSMISSESLETMSSGEMPSDESLDRSGSNHFEDNDGDTEEEEDEDNEEDEDGELVVVFKPAADGKVWTGQRRQTASVKRVKKLVSSPTERNTRMAKINERRIRLRAVRQRNAARKQSD
jgi:hypothetical protein